MKIKPSYKDRMRELFSFGDDLENWKLQTTFREFIRENVEFSGNEAEEIRTRITPIRAARSKAERKAKWIQELTQEKFEEDPIGITESSKSNLPYSYRPDPDLFHTVFTSGTEWDAEYSFYPAIKVLKGLSWRFNIDGKSILSFQKSIKKLIENKSFVFDELPKEYAYSNSEENYFDIDGAAVFKGFTLEGEE